MNNLQKIISDSDAEFETIFNQKFGFGIWDSRASDGHRGEGISSSDVLEHSKAFLHERDKKILEGVIEAIDKAVEDRTSIKQVTDIINAVLEK